MNLIVDALKQRRKQLKLSRRKLASMTGVATSSIVNYENGIQSPSIDAVVKIAIAMDLRIVLESK